MNGSPRNSCLHPPQYHSDRKPAMMPRRTAFTLLELLVVIAIMFGLITIAIVSFSGVRAVANRTASLNALRQMAAGFNSYASDHSGRFLPGYVAEAEMDDPTDIEVVARLPGDIKLNRVTDSCSGGQCDRSSYVWRLTPYLSDQWETMFVDYRSQELIGHLARNEFEKDIYGPGTVGPGDFGISEIPSFGMNSVFIGGDSFHGGSDITNFHPWQNANSVLAATRLSEVKNPSRIILFASSMSDPDASGPDGSAFNIDFGSPELRPPFIDFDSNGKGIGQQQWEFGSTVDKTGVIIAASSASFSNGGGWPIARWGNDLVPVAHLDGSTIAENRFRMGVDGSLWSPRVTAPARIQDSN